MRDNSRAAREARVESRFSHLNEQDIKDLSFDELTWMLVAIKCGVGGEYCAVVQLKHEIDAELERRLEEKQWASRN